MVHLHEVHDFSGRGDGAGGGENYKGQFSESTGGRFFGFKKIIRILLHFHWILAFSKLLC
jgi:hypothetical protein